MIILKITQKAPVKVEKISETNKWRWDPQTLLRCSLHFSTMDSNLFAVANKDVTRNTWNRFTKNTHVRLASTLTLQQKAKHVLKMLWYSISSLPETDFLSGKVIFSQQRSQKQWVGYLQSLGGEVKASTKYLQQSSNHCQTTVRAVVEEKASRRGHQQENHYRTLATSHYDF